MNIRTEVGTSGPEKSASLAEAGRPGRIDTRLAVVLAVTGPMLALATVIVLNRMNLGVISSTWVTVCLLLDACYFLLLVGLVAVRAARLAAARRARFAGSALHARFAGAFTLIAVAPAIAVAIFATVTINFGLENWFSTRVISVIDNSQKVAESYIDEHTDELGRATADLAASLQRTATESPGTSLADILYLESRARGVSHAFIVNSDSKIMFRGYNSYLYDYVPPPDDMLKRSSADIPLIIADEENGEFRALLRLGGNWNGFLYVTRLANATTLRHVDLTRETVSLYRSLQSESQNIFFTFGLFYVAFAAFITLSAVWLGFWFAERMSNPIGRLAEAAQRIGGGDLEARVPEPSSADEIAELSRTFNRMAERVGGQRDELLRAREKEEIRRQFTEGVLGGVPAGVIGLDANRRVEVVNRAAARILGRPASNMWGAQIESIFPEISPVLLRAQERPAQVTRESVKLVSGTGLREIVVRIAPGRRDEGIRGYVVTMEDLTELVSAQRRAAWGDIARRIAHEIKNPLTPIQLAAERLRSRIPAEEEETRQLLERYTNVIVRQVQDISRLVDEFSGLANIPSPQLRKENLRAILDDAALLESTANEGIEYHVEGPDNLVVSCDRALVSQALTNILKNAVHSIEERNEKESEAGQVSQPGRVVVYLSESAGLARVDVEDNGGGFPKVGRHALLEPYRSTRAEGSGLGLAMVSRSVEAHGGEILLLDPPEGRAGAMVRLLLPLGGGTSGPRKEVGTT